MIPIPAQSAPIDSLIAMGLPEKELQAWLRDEPKKPPLFRRLQVVRHLLEEVVRPGRPAAATEPPAAA